MKLFFTLLFPCIFFFNACGGTTWIKQHTSAKEQPVALALIQPETEKEKPENLPQETYSPVGQNSQEQTQKTVQAENDSKEPVKQKEKPAEVPSKPAEETPLAQNIQKEEEQIFLTSEKRLTHPWYYAQETAPVKETPKWFGEELKFDISWSFITAGKAQLNSSKIVEANGQKMYLLEAYAQSYPVIDAVFKVRDINMSWIAEDLTRSLGYWQSVKEGSYARDEWLIFDYDTNTYTIHKQDKKCNIEHNGHSFEGNAVVDMLSSLYFVRNQELPLKGEIFFDIVNRGAQYPLKVVVLGKEKVKVKAGKFNCIVVEPIISGEGIFVSKGKSLKVWLTDDEYKIPVKMAVEVFIGSVKAELTEYSRK